MNFSGPNSAASQEKALLSTSLRPRLDTVNSRLHHTHKHHYHSLVLLKVFSHSGKRGHAMVAIYTKVSDMQPANQVLLNEVMR